MKKLFFLITLNSILIFSCTKTTTQTIVHNDTTTIVTHDTVIVMNPDNPIVGYWIGTLTSINEPSAGELYYSFDIRSDSTIITQSQGADGNVYFNLGTWTMKDSAFTATTISTASANSGVEEILTAVYSKYYGTLSSGVWKNKNGVAGGTFKLSRIN